MIENWRAGYVESITRNTAYCNIRQKNSTIDALMHWFIPERSILSSC